MTYIAKWQLHAISAIIAGATVLLIWFFVSFFQFERASIELPRLFLKLEREIGYNGFIHNFKNFVLRPSEEVYLESALEDYRLAEGTLKDITALTERLQIKTNLEPVESTLREYRGMLDIGDAARREGLSISEIDARVRVSDISADLNIQKFQREIDEVLNTQLRIFGALLAAMVATVVLATVALVYTQVKRSRMAELYSAALTKKSTFIMQAERIARLGGWTIEPDGRMTWTRATMDICGVKEEDFTETTESLWSIIPASDQSKLRVAMNKAVETAGRFVCIHRIQRPDQTFVTVVNSGEATLDADGKVIGFIGILQDVSHLKDVEGKLRQSQKMEAIGNLAGGMAHDFNNILAVVLSNLDLLQISTDPTNNERYINNAITAARNGADLTRSMLSFARRSPLEPTPIVLNDIVHDVVKWSGRLLPASIDVETSLLANLWPVEADRNLAQNALLNLLLNARDSMPNGGSLTIETANIRIDEDYVESHDEDIVPGRYVMLAVTDTGEGMTENTLNKVFDPFFSTKPAGEGSGLGLSMIQGFMKQSSGTVGVYSELGVGTTFKLYFKVSSKEPAEFHPLALDTSASDFQGSRILLVEDNAILLETLSEMLRVAGFDVTTARSGDEALAIWSSHATFDVIITDIVMPGNLQGTHLARKLREDGVDIPFIFMSGYSSEATVHGNGLRPEDIRLMKPIGRLDIISAILTALRGREKK